MTENPTALISWAIGEHTADVNGIARSFPTYRKGEGAPVIVVHEVPGLTAEVISFGEELVAAGYTVVMPHLFGHAGRPFKASDGWAVLGSLCIRREFTKLAVGVSSPMSGWMRSLAARLHEETSRPVGAIGMCFTGGFALGMMVDPWLAAPVLAQPAIPFCVGSRRAADLNLSPADAAAVRQRAAAGQQVLGLRFAKDPMVGPARFEALRELLGDAFIAVELPGKEHSTLSTHRRQVFVDAVLEFLGRQLLT